ncbi:ATP-binding protein [Haladaptatus sp. DJG-WS-42]|uniref:sensor histidine kinase n=1 Tax=Haladaptatus sp. DJG-WS-42 TaxID=3120516 RepID=UPI0030D454A1
MDTKWRVTYANDRGREILSEVVGGSLSTAELIGTNVWEEIPDAEERTFYEEYQHAMELQEPVTFQGYFGPLQQWFRVRVYPSETGVTVTFQELTQDPQTDETLETREEVLREMYDSIVNQELSFEERVDELLRIGQSVIGTSFGTLSRIYGDEYLFEVVRAPDEAIQVGDVVDLEATNCEYAVVSKQTLSLGDVAEESPEFTERAGYTEWGIQCYLGTPIIVDGETYGTFCFYDTEPRAEPFTNWEVTLVELMGKWVETALEQQLANERLEQHNERLEQFASIVSHDLKNPLMVATAWTKMARTEHDFERLDKVEKAHERMETLISDILSLTRAGQQMDTLALCDVERLSRQAWALVPTADAELTIEDEFTIPAAETRLQQLLENLFRNAVTHGGGAVTIRVGELPDGFFVEDTGSGIDPAELDSVFEFGYSTSAEGTGQGLNIVERVAEAHGWAVAVTTGTDGGARFEFGNVQ